MFLYLYYIILSREFNQIEKEGLRERDYNSKNLLILNILSYSDWNLFWDAKILRKQNYDAIQIINPPIFLIVLKLDQLIPQFHFTIKLKDNL